MAQFVDPVFYQLPGIEKRAICALVTYGTRQAAIVRTLKYFTMSGTSFANGNAHVAIRRASCRKQQAAQFAGQLGKPSEQAKIATGGGEILYGDFSAGENSAWGKFRTCPKKSGENSAPPKSSVHSKQKGSWDCDPQKTHTTPKQPSMILQMSDLSKSTTHVLFALP